MKTNNKLFLCIWGEGYIDFGDTAQTEVHTEDFFHTSRGYKSHDIERIKDIIVGQSVNIEDIHAQSVVRVR